MEEGFLMQHHRHILHVLKDLQKSECITLGNAIQAWTFKPSPLCELHMQWKRKYEKEKEKSLSGAQLL